MINLRVKNDVFLIIKSLISLSIVRLLGLLMGWGIFFCRSLYQSKQKAWTDDKNCSKSLGMVGKQSKQCKQNLDLMGTVSHAAYVAMDTCQGQFADRRWNCSSIRRTPKLSRDLTRGNIHVYCLAWDFKLL